YQEDEQIASRDRVPDFLVVGLPWRETRRVHEHVVPLGPERQRQTLADRTALGGVRDENAHGPSSWRILPQLPGTIEAHLLHHCYGAFTFPFHLRLDALPETQC